MYIIDDDNNTIQYFPVPSTWLHLDPTTSNIDMTGYYNHTVTTNQDPPYCYTTDMCHFQIPFKGSGITIFVVQSTFYSNISITLDESWSTIATIHSIPDGEGINFNVMLYNVQALAGVNHTLDIALLDYIFNNGTRIGSDIHFDYAAINDTLLPVISSSPSSLLPSSSSPSSGSGSHSHSVAGPAAGGAVGGIAVIGVLVFFLLFCRRRKSHRNVDQVGQAPSPMVNNYEALPSPLASAPASHGPYVQFPPQTVRPPLAHETTSSSSFLITGTNDRHPTSLTARPLSLPLPLQSNPPIRPNPPAQDGANDVPVVLSLGAEVASNANQAYTTQSSQHTEAQSTERSPATTPTLPTFTGSTDMANEEAAFLNNLHSLNLPAAEITRLREVMRRTREERDQAKLKSNGDGPPPNYQL